MKTTEDSTSWSVVPFYMLVLLVTWTAGFSLGGRLFRSVEKRLTPSSSSTRRESEKQMSFFRKFASLALVFNLLILGGGATSIFWLTAIRFVSAVLVGMLCEQTGAHIHNFLNKPEGLFCSDKGVEIYDTHSFEMTVQQNIYFLYGAGFSILLAGVLYPISTAVFHGIHNSVILTIITAVGLFAGIYTVFPHFKQWHRGDQKYDDPLYTALKSPSRLPLSELNENTSFATVESSGDCQKEQLDRPFLPRTPKSPTSLFHGSEKLTDPLVRLDFSYENTTPLRGRRTSTGDYCNGVSTTRSRTRLGSSISQDDFFDCTSVLSESENAMALQQSFVEEGECSQLIDNRCVYSGGSAAYVLDSTPENYLVFFNGNESKARQAWEFSQRWRIEQNVWNILSLPHPNFNDIKAAYPHFIHGYSKKGYPVIYEQPGRMNLKELFRNGCTVDDMVRHYVYFLEFIANKVCTREEIVSLQRENQSPACLESGSTTSDFGILVVMDVKGAGLSHLSGDVLTYLKRAGDTNSAHYPMTMKKCFVINSPFWLAGAWSGIKGILPDSVQVDLLSEQKYLNVLREYVDEDQIPREYGGSSPYCLGEHPFEVELHQLATRKIDPGNVEAPVVSDPHSIVSPMKRPRNKSTFSGNISDLSPIPCVPDRAIRRRVYSVEQPGFILESGIDSGKKCKTRALGDDNSVLTMILFTWFFLSGAVETIVSVWVVSPVSLGGLGFSPTTSAFIFLAPLGTQLVGLRKANTEALGILLDRPSVKNVRFASLLSSFALLSGLIIVPSHGSFLYEGAAVLLTAFSLFLLSVSISVGGNSALLLHSKTSCTVERGGIPRIFCIRYLADIPSSLQVSKFGEILGSLVVASVFFTFGSFQTNSSRMTLHVGFYLGALVSLAVFFVTFRVAPDFRSQRTSDSCTEETGRSLGYYFGAISGTTISDIRDIVRGLNTFERSRSSRSRTISSSFGTMDVLEKAQIV